MSSGLVVPINFAKLKLWDIHLFNRVSELFNIPDDNEIHEVDLARIYLPLVRQQLVNFYAKSNPLPKTEEPEAFRIDPNEVAEREKLRRAEADEVAAKARLEEYERQGLEPTEANGNAIVKFIKEHDQLRGYFSAQAVDIAVAWLGPNGSNKLTWRKPTPAVPPPAQSVPAVRYLSDGSPELPLDATEQQMRKASIAQLKDLSKSRGEGKSRPGWISTKFTSGLMHGREIE